MTNSPPSDSLEDTELKPDTKLDENEPDMDHDKRGKGNRNNNPKIVITRSKEVGSGADIGGNNGIRQRSLSSVSVLVNKNLIELSNEEWSPKRAGSMRASHKYKFHHTDTSDLNQQTGTLSSSPAKVKNTLSPVNPQKKGRVFSLI